MHQINKTILIVTLLLIFLLNIPLFAPIASADIGPKPSVTIYVENFESKDYMLDLLVPEDYIYFDDQGFNHKYPENLKESPLYKYNEDGWRAAHIRTSLLDGSLYGDYDEQTGLMIHRFGYVGTPSAFKIIAQTNTGELITSNTVEPRQFDAEIKFNLQNGDVKILNKDLMSKIKDLLLYNHHKGTDQFLLRVLLTVFIELLIAVLIFRIKNWAVISITNIVTQLILNVTIYMMFYFTTNYILTLVLIESIVIGLEFMVYFKFIPAINRRKLFVYTLTANIVSLLTGLFL